MYLAALLIAASAAAAERPAWIGKILLAVNEEAQAPAKADTTPEAQDSKIDHTPLEKSPTTVEGTRRSSR